MRSIYIFDVDNTLIDTQAKVHLYMDGHPAGWLGSQAYNRMVGSAGLPAGWRADYSEFRSEERLLREPHLPAMHTLRTISRDSSAEIYIITAREDRGMISRWLFHNGIRIPMGNIITNDFSGKPLGLWKKEKVEEILSRSSFRDLIVQVSLWEDDESCISAIRSIPNIDLLVHPV